MFLQQSQNVDVLSSASQVRVPIGSGLNGATPSFSAIDGSIALNITDGTLYYVGGNVWKTASGPDPIPVTLTVVGSSPNANGASIAGQVLNLQPANASFPGVVSTGAQTFSGVKTFTDGIIAPGLNYSATDPTSGTAANDGFSINNTLSQINLEFADATHNGIVSTNAQTFSGVKTFTDGIIAPGLNYSAIDPTVGTIANDGFSINNALSQINLEFADATHNGIVSTVAQTFGGTKTFSDGIIAPGINYTTIAPIVATDNNGLIIDNILSQISMELADAIHNGIVSTGAQTFGGTKTFSAIVAPGTNYTTIAPTAGTVANVGLVINNSLKQVNLEFADATHNGIVSTAAQTFGGTKTFSAIIAPGTNYTTVAPIVATDNNGLIVDNTLSQIAMELADATHNGIVSTGAQTFGGTKTFSAIVAPGTNYTTIAPTAATAADDGLVINNSLKQVNLEFADATHNGIVSTVAQTFSGVKTFTDGFIAPGTNYTTIDPTAGTVANDGLVINNSLKQVNLEFADGTHNGIMSTVAQNLAGTKIFNNGIRVSNVTPSAGVTNIFGYYFFKNIGTVNVTGGLTGTFTMVAQVFGSVVSLMLSGFINASAGNGIATITETLDTEFRPVTSSHGTTLPVLVYGVYGQGSITISTAGVITIGTGYGADSLPVAWIAGAGNSGWIDCTVQYSLA